MISGIIKVSVSDQPQPSASADNLTYLDLDYSGYHKSLIQYLLKTFKKFKMSQVLGVELAHHFLSGSPLWSSLMLRLNSFPILPAQYNGSVKRNQNQI